MDDLRAGVDETFHCNDEVTLNVESTNITTFKGDRIKLQKLLGGARVALDFECNRIKHINIIGIVNGQSVYHAYISNKNKWRLVDVKPNAKTLIATSSNFNDSEEINMDVQHDREFAKSKVIHQSDDNSPKKIPELINALGDKEKKVAAKFALAKIGEPAIPALIKVLGDQNKQIAAYLTLAKIGEPAIPALIKTLGVIKKQTTAQLALVKIGEPAIPALIDALRFTPMALGEDREQFLASIVHEDIAITAVASIALEKIGKPAIPALINALKNQKKQAIASKILVKIGKPAILPLINSLEDIKIRVSAYHALIKIGKPAIPGLINVGGDKNKQILAYMVLAGMGKTTNPILIDALGDKNKQEAAIFVLAKIGESVISGLINVLGDDKKQIAAYLTLAKIGKPSIAALINSLGDKKKQSVAQLALIKIGEQSIPALINVLEDDKKQAAASAILVEIGMPAIPALKKYINALGDKKKQFLARFTLSQIENKRDQQSLNQVNKVADEREKKSIKSPNGFFQVSSNGVSEIQVTGLPDNNGYYPYDLIVTQSKNPKYFKQGDVSARGSWHPDTQQFYAKRWVMLTKNPQCNHWTNTEWSYSYAPTKVELSGLKVIVWKSSHNYPKNRTGSKLGACIRRSVFPDTCKMGRCKKWEQKEHFDSYIVKLKADAFKLFNSL